MANPGDGRIVKREEFLIVQEYRKVNDEFMWIDTRKMNEKELNQQVEDAVRIITRSK